MVSQITVDYCSQEFSARRRGSEQETGMIIIHQTDGGVVFQLDSHWVTILVHFSAKRWSLFGIGDEHGIWRQLLIQFDSKDQGMGESVKHHSCQPECCHPRGARLWFSIDNFS